MDLFQDMPNRKREIIQRISTMTSQGYDNAQIINELRTAGYDNQEIFDSISTMEEMQQQPQSQQQDQQDYSQQQTYSYQQPAYDSKDQIEQITESLIDEKWQVFKQNLDVLVEWKKQMQENFDTLSEEISSLKSQLKEISKSSTIKANEYASNLEEINGEIKAMGKVFTKIVPTLVDSVHKLENYTEKEPRKEIPKKTSHSRTDLDVDSFKDLL